jgi:peptide/nickel transport system ATP-binding protein/oligopeptide transport system ATP-binding protein
MRPTPDSTLSGPLLEVSGLKTYFQTKKAVVKAVDGVSFMVAPGQTVALVGESGCGKSITALSVMGLVPKPNGKVAAGSIRFAGIDLLSLTAEQMTDLRGDQISMIFQEPMTCLNPVLTIGKQLTEVLRRHRRTPRRKAMREAVGMLEVMGVPRAGELVREYPHQLSGGLRQRVMIAMAMLCGPRLLIADEPTTALDVTIQAQVLMLMKQMRRDFGTAVILITHDLGVVADQADHVIVMYAGQIVESVGADTLFSRPLHPYTAGLMASIPSLDLDRETLYSIPGTVPNAAEFPSGCRFAARCERVCKECTGTEIPLEEKAPGHFVRCICVPAAPAQPRGRDAG